jgi:hypothetical protein
MKRSTHFTLTLTFGAPSVAKKSTFDKVFFGEEHTYPQNAYNICSTMSTDEYDNSTTGPIIKYNSE